MSAQSRSQLRPSPTAVDGALRAVGLSRARPPDGVEEWTDFLDQLQGSLVAGSPVDGSVFEALFTLSPTATMSQDYTEVIEWMDGLRSSGVTDLAAYLADRPHELVAGASRIVVVAANDAAVDVTGVPRRRLLGPIDPDMVNPEAYVSWTAQLMTVWSGEHLLTQEFTGARGDGTPFDARLIMVAPETAAGPDYSRVVVTIHDITVQRQRERDMEDLVAQKTSFVASVSHELRTPLTAVLGFAELLHTGMAMFDPHEAEEFIGTLRTEALDAANLVEDLLVAARTELGQMTVTRRSLDPRQLMESLMAHLPTDAGIDEHIEFDGPHELCIGDAARIRQILRNLVTNAIRYGGGKIRTSVVSRGNSVGFQVWDNGPGILPVDVDRVFRPYERASTNTHGPSSVGIGLSVSRKLAQLMDGTLEYRREPGWSVFELELPIARNELPIPNPRSTAA